MLAAVPLFIFMGVMLERSGIAVKLFEAIHLWTRRLPGGLAVGTVLLCVVFAAASGVVGATESVVGLLAIPVMLKYAYEKGLIAGTICAGGSLGTIIPPSVVVIILAPVALSLANGLEVEPRAFLMAVCFAASAEFMTPVGYQTNLMVYAPGGYRFLDYTRFGAPLNLVFWLTATVLIPRVWPF